MSYDYMRRGLIMGKKKRKKRIVKETEDFGTCVLHCKDCDYEFEMDWETIFAIQECTHGSIGVLMLKNYRRLLYIFYHLIEHMEFDSQSLKYVKCLRRDVPHFGTNASFPLESGLNNLVGYSPHYVS